jgi:hypothetical protein
VIFLLCEPEEDSIVILFSEVRKPVLQSYQQPVPRENSCGSKVISPGNLFGGSTDFPRKNAGHPEADNRLNGAFSEGKQGM